MKNGHHANLLVGEGSEAETFARTYVERLGAVAANNPDFVVLRPDVFGIAEARELQGLAARKAFGSFKIFLISPEKITLEAQNALLKLFEDPTPDTYFFLVTKDKNSIIPTLLSRLSLLELPKGARSLEESNNFLALPLKKRLIFAADFAENEGNLVAFLDDLMLGLEKNGKKDSLRKIFGMRRLVTDKSVGTRLVLEHLSLVL
ncbi:MAG: hypothetical protein WBL19_03320 [Minisyncoccia bacterium]